MKAQYCPYCNAKLPMHTRKAWPIETELTGQTRTTIIKECPNGCMHREALRKGLVKAETA